MRSLFSDDLLAQPKARKTDVHPMRANSQVWHLLLVFPTERAAQPPLFLGCLRVVAQDRDAFVADVDPSGSGNETLDLVLLFAAKGANKYRPPLLIEDLDGVRPHLLQAETKAFQHPCSYAFALPEQSQEEVFGAQVVMMDAPRFVDGKLQHFLSPWGQTDFARREVLSATHDTLDGLTSPLEIDAQACKHFTGHAFPLAEQAQQEMFSPDVVMLEALRLFLSKTHHMPGSLGEPVEAPSLVHACFGSLSTGTGPAVTSQPSADRAKKFLSYHLLILSVCLLTSI